MPINEQVHYKIILNLQMLNWHQIIAKASQKQTLIISYSKDEKHTAKDTETRVIKLKMTLMINKSKLFATITKENKGHNLKSY